MLDAFSVYFCTHGVSNTTLEQSVVISEPPRNLSNAQSVASEGVDEAGTQFYR